MGVGTRLLQSLAVAATLTLVIAALTGFPPATAKRERAVADVTSKLDGVTINWSRGLLIARSAASADLRAPTAKIARVKARRSAVTLATKRLLEAAAKLPQGEGAVGEAAAARSQRWKQLGMAAVVTEIDYSSDGSVVATVGLPLEAVRRALVGASAPPKQQTPAALVVDARKLKVKPAVGVTVTAGDTVYAGPALYTRRAPAKAPTLVASSARGGAFEVPGGAGGKAEKLLSKAEAAAAVIFVLIK